MGDGACEAGGEAAQLQPSHLQSDADLESDDDDVPLSLFSKKSQQVPHHLQETDEELSAESDLDSTCAESPDEHGGDEGDMLDENGQHMCRLTVTKSLDVNHSGKKVGEKNNCFV
jgi:hypothetical protein